MTTHDITPTVRSALPAIAFLIPYERRVITTPLDEAIVRQQLATLFEQLNVVPAPSWFSVAVRYECTIAGDTFTIIGPIANRRYRLLTRGSIRLDPSGTAIDVTLRLTPSNLLLAIGWIALLWLGALVIHFPLVLVLFLTCAMYVMSTAMVKYEAWNIIQRLVTASAPAPASVAQAAIVADGAGWRCAACGGYVRQDATFCKHCKQAF
jgi:hypothetical protein